MAKLVSKVYGDAYVSEISEKNIDLNLALEEIKGIKGIFIENNKISRLLDSPKMDDDEKANFIRGIFENRIGNESLGLLLTIIEKKRQGEFINIFDYIIDCLKELLGIGKAKITTSLPLRDSKKKELEKRILETSHYNSLESEYVVDESIIGGIVIRIGDRVVDSSVKTKIEKMRKILS